jgi:DNA polymerase I
VIEKLKKGKIGKSELVVTSQIQKPLSSYEAVTPHTSAAKKGLERGQTLGVGSVIGYVITSHGGKSISERAEMEEYVKEGDYDANYYIKNQVVPAVIRVMRELGYSEQDLIEGGKQSNLSAFV